MIAAKSIRFIKFRMKANLSGQDQKRRMNSIVKKAMHKVSITQNPNFLLKCTFKKVIFHSKIAYFITSSDEKLADLGPKITENGAILIKIYSLYKCICVPLYLKVTPEIFLHFNGRKIKSD